MLNTFSYTSWTLETYFRKYYSNLQLCIWFILYILICMWKIYINLINIFFHSVAWFFLVNGFFFIFVLLGIEPRVWCMLGKCYTPVLWTEVLNFNEVQLTILSLLVHLFVSTLVHDFKNMENKIKYRF
jgi:hypothetical protein